MIELSIAKRELVLNLVYCLKHENDIQTLERMVPYTQYRAINIFRVDKNWRKHKVRSKVYRGLLGDLYDRFSKYHSPLFIKV